DGSVFTFAASLHVAADGALYAAYRTGFTSADPANEVRVVRSDDCGRKFTKPVTVAPVRALRSPIVPRVGALPQVAADDLNPSTVYGAFPSLSGSPANQTSSSLARLTAARHGKHRRESTTTRPARRSSSRRSRSVTARCTSPGTTSATARLTSKC